MSITDEIKSRLDIADIIADYLPLKKSGSSYSGFCPFHPNTRTPAFAVFPNSQTWRCFGACAEGGDVFSFVMKKEGWDFKEALAYLADRAGVSLEEARPRDKAREEFEDRLTGLLEAAADYFHQLLLYAPQAEPARRYIAGRNLSQETVETFKLGFALDSWEACRSHFSAQGYGDDDLHDSGLLTVNEEKGSRYDRFRNRLIIPIHNVNGQVAGFGARTLAPEGLPKYLNSPQTTMFDKSRLLFGLNLAKRHVREQRQAVIVEGYLDVMQAWQAGFQNVVAQMGTALTEQQLRLLKRYTKRFILALDADAAGVNATLRSLDVAREALDREPDTRFDVRGLIRHEGRLQADIRVVTLPEGNDPDQIIRSDPSLWSKLVTEAEPIVAYVIRVVTEGLNMDDAKAKTAAAQQVLPLIGDVVNPIEREHYRQLLARTLRIDERILHRMSLPHRGRRSKPSEPQLVSARRETSAEGGARARGLITAIGGGFAPTEERRSYFMRQCLTYPQIIGQINRKLVLNQQAVVSESDFVRPEDQALWRHLSQQAARWAVATTGDLCDSLDGDILSDRVEALLTLPESPESDLERLPDKLVLYVLDWRLEQVRNQLSEVKQLLDENQAQRDPETLALYSRQLRELPNLVLSINKARGAMSALGRRTSEQGDHGLR